MTRRLLALLLLAPFVLADKGTVTAQPRLATVDTAIKRFIDGNVIAGAVVVIEHKGKVIHYEAYGHQHRKAATPMRKDSVFRIYSMTKPIASVAALMLVDAGKLGLDDPVSKHIPEVAAMKLADGTKPARPVTVRDLLRHTAGMTYGWGRTPAEAAYRNAGLLRRGQTLAEMAAKLGKLPLVNEPGTRWNYGVAVDVLGRVVEVAAKQPFDAFLRERLFGPLGMPDTDFHVRKENVARFTTNYGRGGAVVDPGATSRYLTAPKFFSGGGGLVSTAGDYLRFCRMMLAGGKAGERVFLEPGTHAAMTRNQLAKEYTPITFGRMPMPGVGFGLGVSVVLAGREAGEYGWAGAASTGFFVSPKEQLIVITMTQVMPMNPMVHQTVRGLAYAAVRR